jgi:hypothetical protein
VSASDNHRVLRPDLSQLTRSPVKYSAARNVSGTEYRQAVKEAAAVFAHCATLDVRETFADIHASLNLPKFIKQAGLDMLSRLVATCQAYPELARAVDEYYGWDAVHGCVKAAGAADRTSRTNSILNAQYRAPARPTTGSVLPSAKPLHPIKTGALKVITHDLTVNTQRPEGLTDAEAEKLRQDTILIKDDRTDAEISTPWNLRVEQTLRNPGESGLYQVLTKEGQFDKCLVLMHPFASGGRKRFCTVAKLGDNDMANWLNIASQYVWVGSQEEPEAFRKWYDGLTDAKSLSEGDSRYVVLNYKGEGTAPFKVIRDYGDERGTKVYEVDFEDYCDMQGTADYPALAGPYRDPLEYDKYRDGARIHLDGKGGTALRVSQGDVYIPRDCKLLKVKHSKRDDEVKTDKADQDLCGCSAPCPPFHSGSEPAPFRPGNIVDAQLEIMGKTAALTIHHRLGQIQINDQPQPSQQAAVISLVVDHGFREDTAEHLLKQAAKTGRGQWRVKYADPYLTDNQPGTPAIPDAIQASGSVMNTDVPTYSRNDFAVEIPSVTAKNTDRQIYNPNTMLDRRDADQLQRAADSGQREIFDTAMIGSLLKHVRDDAMIDEHLGDLTKALDRLGRIIFMFYWRQDQFKERYGASELPEMEDALRNSFESLGDCLLALREKTVEPYPEEDTSDVDLGPVAKM